jgi:sulfite exporter TauE/SafE
MSERIDLAGFLLLGLLGGLGHCVGMCSPFVLLVSRRYVSGGDGTVLAGQLWYHSGRIATYAALGAAAGLAGSAVDVAGGLYGVRRAAPLLAGILLLGSAVPWLLKFSGGTAPSGTIFGRIMTRMRGWIPGHPFLIGLLLGLLPCGLLYSAVIAAVSRDGAAEGALALVIFGLGTAPALLGVSVADALLTRRRPFINGVAHLFVLVMGAWFVWSALTR